MILLLACATPCPEGYEEDAEGRCLEAHGDTGESDTGAPGSDDTFESDGGDTAGEETDSGAESDSGDPPTDADGDGHSTPEDCDDADPDVFPGAEEVCGNGVDDNCDGGAPGCGWEGEVRLPDGAWTLAGDVSSEYAGAMVAVGGDTNGDGLGDLLVAAPWSSRAGNTAGAVYIVVGPILADLELADHPTLLGPGDPIYFGAGLSFAGDPDGDGYDDVLVGAPNADPGSSTEGPGAAWLYAGPIATDLDPTGAAVDWSGEGALGLALAGGGDLTGDAADDVLIGAPTDDSYRDDGGAAMLYAGPVVQGDPPAARFYGGKSGCDRGYLGSALTPLGDVDGDGAGDLAIGEPSWCTDDGDVGAIHVYFGPLAGNLTSGDADARVYGNITMRSYWLGSHDRALSAPGDVDADGRADLLVGNDVAAVDIAPNTGSAYLVTASTLLAGEVDLYFADWTVEGSSREQLVGVATAAAGDQDGNGHADVLVGASQDATYGNNGGAVFLFLAPLSGTQTGADATATFYPEDQRWWLGAGLAGGMDLSGDGWPELVLGAPMSDARATYAGNVFVLAGGGF